MYHIQTEVVQYVDLVKISVICLELQGFSSESEQTQTCFMFKQILSF